MLQGPLTSAYYAARALPLPRVVRNPQGPQFSPTVTPGLQSRQETPTPDPQTTPWAPAQSTAKSFLPGYEPPTHRHWLGPLGSPPAGAQAPRRRESLEEGGGCPGAGGLGPISPWTCSVSGERIAVWQETRDPHTEFPRACSPGSWRRRTWGGSLPEGRGRPSLLDLALCPGSWSVAFSCARQPLPPPAWLLPSPCNCPHSETPWLPPGPRLASTRSSGRSRPPRTVISLIFRVFSLIHFSLRTFSVALISSLSFLISYQQENRQMTEELWDGDTQMTPAPGQAWGLGARLPRCPPPVVPSHPVQPSCSLTPRGRPVLGGEQGILHGPQAPGPRCRVHGRTAGQEPPQGLTSSCCSCIWASLSLRLWSPCRSSASTASHFSLSVFLSSISCDQGAGGEVAA